MSLYKNTASIDMYINNYRSINDRVPVWDQKLLHYKREFIGNK